MTVWSGRTACGDIAAAISFARPSCRYGKCLIGSRLRARVLTGIKAGTGQELYQPSDNNQLGTKPMKRLSTLACAALLAATPVQFALAQDGQEAAVMAVIENVFPGYTDPGYADCILQNANESQAERIASAGESGSYRAAAEPLKEVAMKNTTQNCIIAAGLPRFPL